MTLSTISPQVRLAASRKALLRQMANLDDRHAEGLSSDSQEFAGATAGSDQQLDRSSTWQVLTQAVMAWWKHHPLQLAVDVGRPFLNNYAKDKPWQLLGIAAGSGAALVLVKPWRLVSITGLAVAAIKSTNISGTLLSMLSGSRPKPVTQHQHLPQSQQQTTKAAS